MVDGAELTISGCRTTGGRINQMSEQAIKPKKSLGQHWLFDEFSLDSMCDSIDVKTGDVIVEIGPGLGTLTQKLIDRKAKITAVEFDEDLANKLIKKFDSQIKVVNQDILKFNFEELPPNYKICANIPYYLTSNLIRILTELKNKPQSVALLVQKEVAERICSGAGQMSLLSVWSQFNFDCKLGILVPAQLFDPPPKVDSQIVIMNHLDNPIYREVDYRLLQQVVKAGFSNKRKNLVNCLSAGLQVAKIDILKILNTLSIDQNTRAQELELKEWISLTKILENT